MRRQQPEENPDVYKYDDLPNTFRRQVIHILVDTLGAYRDGRYSYLSVPPANGRWETLFSRYTREMGIFRLGNDPDANPYEQCLQYLQVAPTEQALDFIDCAFQYIDKDLRQDSEYIVH